MYVCLQMLFDQIIYSDTDSSQPPKGAWFDNRGGNIKFGAYIKTWMGFLFIVPSGIVSYIVYVASSNVDFKADFIESVFLIGPFTLMSNYLWWVSFLYLFGKVTLTFTQHRLSVFTGIGILGIKKKVDLSNDVRVKWETYTPWGRGKHILQERIVLLNGKRRIKFGYDLEPKRKAYIFQTLQMLLANRKKMRSS